MPHQPDTADLARRVMVPRKTLERLQDAFVPSGSGMAIHIKALLAQEPDALAQAVLEKDAEIERLRGVLGSVEGNIAAMRDAITHPHGRRAHFIDSQDQIRVDALDAALEEIFQARTALKDKTNG